jgi:hypothetical protein
MITPFPWPAAGFLVLGISLVFIAIRQREIDISQFPMQVQYGPWAGLMLGLIGLGAFAFEFVWWAFPIALAMALIVAGLARLLPRPVRIALALLSILGWPFCLMAGCISMLPKAG